MGVEEGVVGDGGGASAMWERVLKLCAHWPAPSETAGFGGGGSW